MMRDDINIVQIGAFDGVTSDPVSRWIGHSKVRAVLVEPQPIAYEKLKSLFNNVPNTILVRAAITESNGSVSLWGPSGQDCSTVASLSEEHVRNFAGRATPISVRGITVKSLLQETATPRVDLLQIDTEGHDFSILQQFFAIDLEPLVINLESCHLNQAERTLLYREFEARDYTYLDYSLDTLAVKKKLLDELHPAPNQSIPN